MTAKIATGRFVWFEYVSSDAQKAQGFFGELFGWGTQRVPMGKGGYTMISLGERTIGGYADGEGKPHWRSHLQVVDAEATAAQVKKLGGTIVTAPVKMGEAGTMALVRDPQGSELALWQPASASDAPAPSVGSFCWNELTAKDPAAAATFYCAVGGFTENAMEMPGMGKYIVLESGGEPRAGVLAPMMPQQPHAWLPYVQVASTDKTIERASKLGGQTYVPATDIPNVGRFAILGDPHGAALGILQP